MTEMEKLQKRLNQIEKENIGLMKNIESRQAHYAMNKKDIEELKQQIEDLKAEDSVWKPKEKEKYYCFNNGMQIMESHNDLCQVDISRYEIGNCFKTKEEAEKVKRHLITRAKLQRIADRLNKGQKIDWNNGEGKYYLYYDFDIETIVSDWYFAAKNEGSIYCLDKNFKDIAIKEIGQELENYLKGE